jgi:[acyl-carrier-protein] S-malonyltransferase
VAALIEAAQAAGARRALRLNVSGGFHSPLTASAERRLRPALEAATFHDPATAFFSTVTCRVEEHAGDMVEILVRQLVAPVRFTQAVTELAGLGVTQFVEIGPGGVLSGLVKRIDRSVQAISVSSPDGLAKLEAARV